MKAYVRYRFRVVKKIKALVLIDGEHYPPVILQAVNEIRRSGEIDVVGAVFLGGTEKIDRISDIDLGVEIYHSPDYLEAITRAVAAKKPDVVIDLSDEPVVGYEERMRIASLLASFGVSYGGSDFNFQAPRFSEVDGVKTVGIIGTGKRVGKTAVSAHFVRYARQKGKKVVVVAMGRGGPKKPVYLNGEEILVDNRFLIELKEQGKHAASDYVEDAMMSRVATVGCRRCGGGFAGVPFISNVREGVELALSHRPELLVLEGSGSAIPPVKAGKYITVSSVLEPECNITGYFGPFRIMISDLLVLTNCEGNDEKRRAERVIREAKKLNPSIKVAATVFRPKPLEDIAGSRVFLAMTAPPEQLPRISQFIKETQNCEVVYASANLANRSKLREELEARKKDFDTLLTELKAAAVDVALDFADKHGKRTVFFDNVPHTVGGDEKLENLFTDFLS